MSKSIKKITAASTLFFYLVSGQGMSAFAGVPSTSAGVLMAPAALPFARMSTNARQIAQAPLSLPANLGRIEEFLPSVSGSKRPAILHLQTAHGDYASQMALVRVLNYLKKKESFDLLLLEGADEALDPELDRFFKNDSWNQQVAKERVKAGRMSGAAYFLMRQPKGSVKAVGVESAEAYRNNRKDFLELIQKREVLETFLKGAESDLDRLFAKKASKSILDLRRQERAFNQGRLDWTSWIEKLKKTALADLNLDLAHVSSQKDWPSLLRFLWLRSMDPVTEKGEDSLEDEGLSDSVKRILKNSHSGGDFRYGEIRLILEEWLSLKNTKKTIKPSANLKATLKKMALQNEIRPQELWRETEILTQKLMDSYAETPAEKELLKLDADLKLLRGLLLTELSFQEYQRVLERGEEIAPSRMSQSLKVIRHPARLVAEQSVSLRVGAGFKPARGVVIQTGRVINPPLQNNAPVTTVEIDSIVVSADHEFQTALNFYSGAKSREKSMAENALKLASQSDERYVVLVTGGFHATGLRDVLVEKGMTYLRVTPKTGIEKDGYSALVSQDPRAVYRQAFLDHSAGVENRAHIEDAAVLPIPRIDLNRLGVAEDGFIANRTNALEAWFSMEGRPNREAAGSQFNESLFARQYGVQWVGNGRESKFKISRSEVRTAVDSEDLHKRIHQELHKVDEVLNGLPRGAISEFSKIQVLLAALYGGSVQLFAEQPKVARKSKHTRPHWEKRVYEFQWGLYAWVNQSNWGQLSSDQRNKVKTYIEQVAGQLELLGIRVKERIPSGVTKGQISIGDVLTHAPAFQNPFLQTFLGDSKRIKSASNAQSRLERAVELLSSYSAVKGRKLTPAEAAYLRSFDNIFIPHFTMDKAEPFIIRVQHNSARGPYKGGIRLVDAFTLVNDKHFKHLFDDLKAGLNLQELRYFLRKYILEETLPLSFGMTSKAAVANLPYGGGKGTMLAADVVEDSIGVKAIADLHGGQDVTAYLFQLARGTARVFAEASFVRSDRDIPAADLNSGRYMDAMADEQIETVFDALRPTLEGILARRRNNLPSEDVAFIEQLKAVPQYTSESLEKPLYLQLLTDYGAQLRASGRKIPSWAKPFFEAAATYTSKSEKLMGSFFRTDSTGYGGIHVLRDVVVREKLSRSSEKPLLGMTAKLMGLGAVGAPAAEKMIDEGMLIKLISLGPLGALYKADGGFTREEILLIRKMLAEKKNLGLLGKEGAEASGVEYIIPEQVDSRLLELDVDVFVLAAVENAIHKDNVARANGKIFLELANGAITNDAYDRLVQDHDTMVIPDTMANAGGVTVSYYEWQQNLNNERWTRSDVIQRLEKQLSGGVKRVAQVRTTYKTDWRTAADVLMILEVLEARRAEKSKSVRSKNKRSEVRVDTDVSTLASNFGTRRSEVRSVEDQIGGFSYVDLVKNGKVGVFPAAELVQQVTDYLQTAAAKGIFAAAVLAKAEDRENPDFVTWQSLVNEQGLVDQTKVAAFVRGKVQPLAARKAMLFEVHQFLYTLRDDEKEMIEKVGGKKTGLLLAIFPENTGGGPDAPGGRGERPWDQPSPYGPRGGNALQEPSTSWDYRVQFGNAADSADARELVTLQQRRRSEMRAPVLEETTLDLKELTGWRDGTVIGHVFIASDNSRTLAPKATLPMTDPILGQLTDFLGHSGNHLVVNSGDADDQLIVSQRPLQRALASSELHGRYRLITQGGQIQRQFSGEGSVTNEIRIPNWPIPVRQRYSELMIRSFYDRLESAVKLKTGPLAELAEKIDLSALAAWRTQRLSDFRNIVDGNQWGQLQPGEGKYVFKLLSPQLDAVLGDLYLYDAGGIVTLELENSKAGALAEFSSEIAQDVRAQLTQDDKPYIFAGPTFVDMSVTTKAAAVGKSLEDLIQKNSGHSLVILMGDAVNDLPTFQLARAIMDRHPQVYVLVFYLNRDYEQTLPAGSYVRREKELAGASQVLEFAKAASGVNIESIPVMKGVYQWRDGSRSEMRSVPFARVRQLAQEYGLLSLSEYSYALRQGDLTFWAQQNISEDDLTQREFVPRQKIRQLAGSTRYKVSMPSGLLTPGDLSFWAEQLRDQVKTEAQIRAEFNRLAPLQPSVAALIKELRKRTGAVTLRPKVRSLAAAKNLLTPSDYAWTLKDYDVAWWADWGFLEAELNAQFAARQTIRGIAQETHYKVEGPAGHISSSALSFWAEKIISGALTEEQIRRIFLGEISMPTVPAVDVPGAIQRLTQIAQGQPPLDEKEKHRLIAQIVFAYQGASVVVPKVQKKSALSPEELTAARTEEFFAIRDELLAIFSRYKKAKGDSKEAQQAQHLDQARRYSKVLPSFIGEIQGRDAAEKAVLDSYAAMVGEKRQAEAKKLGQDIRGLTPRFVEQWQIYNRKGISEMEKAAANTNLNRLNIEVVKLSKRRLKLQLLQFQSALEAESLHQGTVFALLMSITDLYQRIRYEYQWRTFRTEGSIKIARLPMMGALGLFRDNLPYQSEPLLRVDAEDQGGVTISQIVWKFKQVEGSEPALIPEMTRMKFPDFPAALRGKEHALESQEQDYAALADHDFALQGVKDTLDWYAKSREAIPDETKEQLIATLMTVQAGPNGRFGLAKRRARHYTPGTRKVEANVLPKPGKKIDLTIANIQTGTHEKLKEAVNSIETAQLWTRARREYIERITAPATHRKRDYAYALMRDALIRDALNMIKTNITEPLIGGRQPALDQAHIAEQNLRGLEQTFFHFIPLDNPSDSEIILYKNLKNQSQEILRALADLTADLSRHHLSETAKSTALKMNRKIDRVLADLTSAAQRRERSFPRSEVRASSKEDDAAALAQEIASLQADLRAALELAQSRVGSDEALRAEDDEFNVFQDTPLAQLSEDNPAVHLGQFDDFLGRQKAAGFLFELYETKAGSKDAQAQEFRASLSLIENQIQKLQEFMGRSEARSAPIEVIKKSDHQIAVVEDGQEKTVLRVGSGFSTAYGDWERGQVQSDLVLATIERLRRGRTIISFSYDPDPESKSLTLNLQADGSEAAENILVTKIGATLLPARSEVRAGGANELLNQAQVLPENLKRAIRQWANRVYVEGKGYPKAFTDAGFERLNGKGIEAAKYQVERVGNIIKVELEQSRVDYHVIAKKIAPLLVQVSEDLSISRNTRQNLRAFSEYPITLSWLLHSIYSPTVTKFNLQGALKQDAERRDRLAATESAVYEKEEFLIGAPTGTLRDTDTEIMVKRPWTWAGAKRSLLKLPRASLQVFWRGLDSLGAWLVQFRKTPLQAITAIFNLGWYILTSGWFWKTVVWTGLPLGFGYGVYRSYFVFINYVTDGHPEDVGEIMMAVNNGLFVLALAIPTVLFTAILWNLRTHSWMPGGARTPLGAPPVQRLSKDQLKERGHTGDESDRSARSEVRAKKESASDAVDAPTVREGLEKLRKILENSDLGGSELHAFTQNLGQADQAVQGDPANLPTAMHSVSSSLKQAADAIRSVHTKTIDALHKKTLELAKKILTAYPEKPGEANRPGPKTKRRSEVRFDTTVSTHVRIETAKFLGGLFLEGDLNEWERNGNLPASAARYLEVPRVRSDLDFVLAQAVDLFLTSLPAVGEWMNRFPGQALREQEKSAYVIGPELVRHYGPVLIALEQATPSAARLIVLAKNDADASELENLVRPINSRLPKNRRLMIKTPQQMRALLLKADTLRGLGLGEVDAALLRQIIPDFLPLNVFELDAWVSQVPGLTALVQKFRALSALATAA